MIWIILILVLFYFVARPAWRVYQAYRNPQKAMEDFLRRNGFNPAGASGTASDGEPARDHGRKGGWSAPRPKKKKIDPNSGDYVRFTNLPAEDPAPNNGTSYTETTVEVESQTIDVTWEELPE